VCTLLHDVSVCERNAYWVYIRELGQEALACVFDETSDIKLVALQIVKKAELVCITGKSLRIICGSVSQR
jgi:hypothetical protein